MGVIDHVAAAPGPLACPSRCARLGPQERCMEHQNWEQKIPGKKLNFFVNAPNQKEKMADFQSNS